MKSLCLILVDPSKAVVEQAIISSRDAIRNRRYRPCEQARAIVHPGGAHLRNPGRPLPAQRRLYTRTRPTPLGRRKCR